MSLRKRGGPAVAAVSLGMGAAFCAGGYLRAARPSARPLTPVRVAEATEPGTPARLPVLPDDSDGGVGTFDAVYDLVHRNFTDPLPTDTKLSLGAARAMVASLEEPNSYFVTPEQRQLIEGEGAGKFAGIGAALFIRPVKREGYTDYKIVIVAALPGSPAEKAGLKSGDIVSRVDDKYVLGYNPMIQYTQVVQRFENKAATEAELETAAKATRAKLQGGIGFAPVQLLLRGDAMVKAIASKPSYKITVERAGVKEPIVAVVTPAVTQVDPVSSKTIDGGAGYLKIAAFTDAAPAAVTSALASLSAPQGLVVDLRGNPGGSFSAAQKIVGSLAGAGPFAVEIGAGGKKTALAAPSAGSGTKPTHLTVLVDRGTGSTAEAVAEALTERAGATLVGEKTFGDSVVQTLYKLADGSGFTLNTGKLVSPKGVGWAWTGLAPRVAVAPGTAEEQVLARAVAALKGPLTAQAAPAGK